MSVINRMLKDLDSRPASELKAQLSLPDTVVVIKRSYWPTVFLLLVIGLFLLSLWWLQHGIWQAPLFTASPAASTVSTAAIVQQVQDQPVMASTGDVAISAVNQPLAEPVVDPIVEPVVGSVVESVAKHVAENEAAVNIANSQSKAQSASLHSTTSAAIPTPSVAPQPMVQRPYLLSKAVAVTKPVESLAKTPAVVSVTARPEPTAANPMPSQPIQPKPAATVAKLAQPARSQAVQRQPKASRHAALAIEQEPLRPIIAKAKNQPPITLPEGYEVDKQAAVKTLLPVTERAEAWYQEGLKYLAKGAISAAQQAFDRALTLAPSHLAARTQLIQCYVALQQSNKIEASIREGLSYYPEQMDWRLQLAALQLQQNRYQEVLLTLPDHLGANLSLDYWALRGAAAQHLNEYAIALAAYRKLTQVEPEVAKWWLGLAIAQESVRDLAGAQSSYYLALQIGGLTPQSREFIQQRQSILEQP